VATGVPINTDADITFGLGCTSTIAVQAGDLIVSGICAFFPTGSGPPWGYTCIDTDGNTYELQTCAARGFGHVSYAWAIAQNNATISITHENAAASAEWRTQIVTNFRWPDGDAPPLSEWAMLIGPSAGSTPPFSAFTSSYSLADSTVITFAGAVGSFGAVSFTSYSGDTEVFRSGSSPAQSMALFYRAATGPGVENTRIGNDLGLTYAGQSPMITAVFSRPLSRPGGTTEQYQMRPGCGFTSSPGDEGGFEAPYYIGATNRPICATMPYLPLVDSLLCIGVSQQSHVVTPTVYDDYGNVYTMQGISPIGGSSANQCVVALYTCIVAVLPPTGEAFIVRASLPGPYTGVVYQPTAIGVAERVITGQAPSAYSVAVFDDVAVDVFSTESLIGVPAGTYLFAFAANATDGTDDSVTWTALNGFTLRSNYGFIQDPAWSVTNDARNGAAAILDMFAVADGDYFAQVQDVRDVGGIPSGGMALLGVTLVDLTLAITCPVANTGILGEFFSATIVATGGTPPYTYAVTSGAFPSGVTLDSATGVISGIPLVAGSYSYTVTVTDSLGFTASVGAPCPLTISISPPPFCETFPVGTEFGLIAYNEPNERDGS